MRQDTLMLKASSLESAGLVMIATAAMVVFRDPEFASRIVPAAGLLPWTGLLLGRLFDDVGAIVRRERLDGVEAVLWAWTFTTASCGEARTTSSSGRARSSESCTSARGCGSHQAVHFGAATYP